MSTPLPTLASAENWTLCDPHELFLERATTVIPGEERAFIEAQIEAFSNRARWLEEQYQSWYWTYTPPQEGNSQDRGALAVFIAERAAAYRAYAQALAAATAPPPALGRRRGRRQHVPR